jgi:hypothetical protein
MLKRGGMSQEPTTPLLTANQLMVIATNANLTVTS